MFGPELRKRLFGGVLPARLVGMLEWPLVEALGHFTCVIVASDSGIRAIEFAGGGQPPGRESDSNALLSMAAQQLHAYFGGELRGFELPLDMQGTEFQQRVWQELLRIPYAETRSYSHDGCWECQRQSGRWALPTDGTPFPLWCPATCVIGAAGSLVGYGGGLPLERFLLDLEARHSHLFQEA